MADVTHDQLVAAEPESARMPAAWKAGLITLVVSVVICEAIFLAALAAGLDFSFDRADGRTAEVTVGTIIIVLVLAVMAGTGLLALVGRHGAKRWRTVAVVGLVLGLVSVVTPLSSRAEIDTKLVLAAMHVTASVAWFVVAMAMLRRSRRDRGVS